MFPSSFFFFAFSIAMINTAISMDGEQTENRLIGNPNVTCHSDRIQFSILTLHPFQGRIFAKGMTRRSECLREFSLNGTAAEIEFYLTECGMVRERKMSPSMGLSESLIVIVSFHYLFVTKSDRVFSVKCFYSQTRFSKLQHTVNISNMAATELAMAEEKGSRAECRYEVRIGTPQGPIATFAEVGQRLYHQWICEGSDDFRILVKECRVVDGTNEKFILIDNRGCAVDPSIVGDPIYSPKHRSAQLMTHAFKFADTDQIGFQCTVQLCSENGGDLRCDAISPPLCTVENNLERGTMMIRRQFAQSRQRDMPRSIMSREIDVHSPPLSIIESQKLIDPRHPLSLSFDHDDIDIPMQDQCQLRLDKTICLSPAQIYLITGLTVLLLIGLTAALMVQYLYSIKYHRQISWSSI